MFQDEEEGEEQLGLKWVFVNAQMVSSSVEGEELRRVGPSDGDSEEEPL